MNKVDLNPNNYNIDDIINIFEIENIDIEYINRNVVNQRFYNITKNANIKSNNSYYRFLNVLRMKIIDHIENDNSDKESVNSHASYETYNDDDHNNHDNILPEQDNIISYQHPDRSNLLLNPSVKNINDSFIINQRIVEPRDTYDNKYPSDILNPIRKKTIKKILSIDSLFRETNYNSNDFVINLKDPIKNIISLKVTSLELPHVWFMFDKSNHSNIFYIEMFNMNDGTGMFYDDIYTIEIPSGNYSPIEFQDLMNNLFTNILPSGGPDFLTLRINESTGGVIIRANDINDSDLGTSPVPFDTNPTNNYLSPNFRFILNFDVRNIPQRPLYYNAGWSMGFRKSTYELVNTNILIDNFNTIPPITYYTFLESESYYGSSILTYVYLEIDDFNRNNNGTVISPYNQVACSSDVIAKIPLTSGSNTIIINTSNDNIFKERNYFGPINIEKLRVRLLDKYGEVININNNNYSISLEVTQIYS
jgi:hypothetical protein